MLRTLIIALAAIIGTTALANAPAMKEIKTLPSQNPSSNCYHIDAKTGWQRITIPTSATSQVLTIIGPHNITPQDAKAYRKAKKIGWSVNKAFHKPVGPEGHSGKDAAALKPWGVYKYLKDAPFGSMIVRLPNGWTGDVLNPNRPISLTDEAYYDFRINDADEALWDNGGFLIMCLLDADLYSG